MLNTMIVGLTTTTGRPSSLAEKLTEEQKQALDTWAAAQTPNERGSVDLLRWPGWGEALQENIRTGSGRKIMRGEDKTVVLTLQLQADLRLAWKVLNDAGHKAVADRVFHMLEGDEAPVTDRT